MRVIEVFDSLQGEGVWTGTPMTFVRLAGCNGPELGLGCVRWCDTPESWAPESGEALAVTEILTMVRLPRVCVTGGEPLIQAAELRALVAALHSAGRRVHLETNGTLALPTGAKPDWVTVSPKPPDYGVSSWLAGNVDELKFVVDDAFEPEIAETLSRRFPHAAVCLQPESGGGEQARARAVHEVMSHPTWRLSLQLHKVLGLR